jgi:uncharacterized protein (TIGR03435 family)
MKRALSGAFLGILLSVYLPGQPPAPSPAFEAADVHVTEPGSESRGRSYQPGGRFEWHGGTMLDMICMAWAVDPEKVAGGPSWLNSDKFEIIAKPPSGAAPATLAPMLRNLLTDRFQLVVREDSRDTPVYVLTLGKKARKLQPAAEGRPQTSRGTGDPALSIHTVLHSYSMADFADWLPRAAPNFVKLPVVDETGLKGAFDFQMDWMGWGPYNQAKANPDGAPPVGAFDAVENIGLKLDLAKRPRPVLVVDKVNRTPTPNAPGLTIEAPKYPTAFDVAELRPAKAEPWTADPLGQLRIQNGRIEIMGATLKGLLAFALNSTPERIVGPAKWMGEDRFDVIAKMPADVPFGAAYGMLKSLLTERFQLVTHSDQQPLPVFVLLAGKKPKLKESDGTARSDCKLVNTADRHVFTCRNTTMAEFAERLPPIANLYIHPPLLDLTEIKGAYDFELSWTPRMNLPEARVGANAPASQAATPAGDLTVFEAVDKQLGLRLEEQKHPIPVVVIDRATQPPLDK